MKKKGTAIVPIDSAGAGDIISMAGLASPSIGHTVANVEVNECNFYCSTESFMFSFCFFSPMIRHEEAPTSYFEVIDSFCYSILAPCSLNLPVCVILAHKLMWYFKLNEKRNWHCYENIIFLILWAQTWVLCLYKDMRCWTWPLLDIRCYRMWHCRKIVILTKITSRVLPKPGFILFIQINPINFEINEGNFVI